MVTAPIEVLDQSRPALLPGGMLVRTAFTLVHRGGYSCSGVVLQSGENADEFRVGDSVAFIGDGCADTQYTPKNLCVRLTPSASGLEPAASIAAGAVALEAVREAGMQIGETAAVIGLGPIANFARQMLQSAGCRVIAVEPNGSGAALELADAAIVTNNELLAAASFCREGARVVVLGYGELPSPPAIYRDKHLDLRFPRDIGPGRFDPQYEELGIDYPIGYVRWTAKRNMEAVRDLIAGSKLDLSSLGVPRLDAASVSEPLPQDVLLTYDWGAPVENIESIATGDRWDAVAFSRRFASTTLALRRFLGSSTEPRVVQYRVNTRVHHAGDVSSYFDLITHLTGSHPVEVFARSVRGGEDHFHAQIRYANGSLGTLQYLVDHAVAADERIEVFGGGASAVIDNFRTLTVCRDGRIRKQKSRSLPAHTGSTPEVPVEETVTAARLWSATLESIRLAAAVKL